MPAVSRAGINPTPTEDVRNTLIANALLTLTLCRDGRVTFRSFCVYIIFSATDSPVGDLRWLSKNRGVSCFSGFPCRDASLRNEGCFFLVPAGRSLLRSTTVPERNRGRSPCITARVFPVFVGTICHFLALRSLRLGERKSPTDSRVGINPTPTVAECSNVLIISVLHDYLA